MADSFTPILTTTDWNDEWKALQAHRKKAEDAAYWDGRAATFTSKHGSHNAYVERFIEFAGIKNGKISNVKISGKYRGDSTNEAIQLDTCMNSSVSPQGAPWDGTANQNITIEKCRISVPAMSVGIGFNSKARKKSSNIKIIKNKIKVKKYPVYLNKVKKVTVKKSGKVKRGIGVSGVHK